MRLRGFSPSPERVDRTFRSFAISQGSRPDAFGSALSYPPGIQLFRQGDPSDGVFLLEHGLVKVLIVRANGDERIVGLRAGGWLMGVAAAVLKLPHAVTAVTVSACRIARLGAEEFLRRLRSDPALSWWLHEMHSRQTYEELVQLAEATAASARERLEGFLGRLVPWASSLNDHGEHRIDLVLRHWEIAQLIGVTPPYLSGLFGELERAGAVRREGEGLVLLAQGGGRCTGLLQLSERAASGS
jgi:CRP-like cAMP-binding protein